ncbi:MAG: HEAT repeat domain-containing protein [Paludisphaera borealis]|uniref:HEAT repeat domain-containing protein n=1 Tax=Paludisphaera borealis TaxID=1387353 RepID=UPI0028408DA5|nr:HEAT repeat domain-containing protein [Paludisphaera borealis]MDR3622194.1 HEAT repeat domain-containing protein [Paludisphaera borealis]
MAKRASLDDKLAAVRLLRDQPTSPALVAELRKSIADRSNFLASAAAVIAGDRRLVELASDLESAYKRFLIDPLKNDKLCRAKIAIVQALDKMEHDRPETFQNAARHIQLEPVWEGLVDAAAPLRALALIALVRIDAPGLLTLLVDALNDPLQRVSKDDEERVVRSAAAQALGYQGSEAAGLLLRLKARVGDRDPDVISECLHGLLTISHQEHLGFVAGFLEPHDEARCEAAVLALGRSRLPEALGPLEACWRRASSPPLQEAILLAVAMLRTPEAVDHLLDFVAGENEPHSRMALSALKIHCHDARLTERIERVVAAKGNRELKEQFERDFRTDD